MLNMSATGILIRTQEALQVGTKLELSMEWTGLYHGRQSMRLLLLASVTRIGVDGAALRIHSSRFRDLVPARAPYGRAQTAVA